MRIEERLDIIELRLNKIEHILSQINARTSGLQIIGCPKSYDKTDTYVDSLTNDVLNSLRES